MLLARMRLIRHSSLVDHELPKFQNFMPQAPHFQNGVPMGRQNLDPVANPTTAAKDQYRSTKLKQQPSSSRSPIYSRCWFMTIMTCSSAAVAIPVLTYGLCCILLVGTDRSGMVPTTTTRLSLSSHPWLQLIGLRHEIASRLG